MSNRQDVLPKLNYSKFRGEWIVICENMIIAHNKDLTLIQDEINACKKVPTIAKIPAKGQLIF